MPGNWMGVHMKKTALIIALAAGALSLSACKKAEEAAPVADVTTEAAADMSAAPSDAASEDAGAAKAAAPAKDGDGKGNDVKT